MKVSSNKIGWNVSVGGVKVESGSPLQNTQFYMLFEPYLHNPEHMHMEPIKYAQMFTYMFERCLLSIGA